MKLFYIDKKSQLKSLNIEASNDVSICKFDVEHLIIGARNSENNPVIPKLLELNDFEQFFFNSENSDLLGFARFAEFKSSGSRIVTDISEFLQLNPSLLAELNFVCDSVQGFFKTSQPIIAWHNVENCARCVSTTGGADKFVALRYNQGNNQFVYYKNGYEVVGYLDFSVLEKVDHNDVVNVIPAGLTFHSWGEIIDKSSQSIKDHLYLGKELIQYGLHQPELTGAANVLTVKNTVSAGFNPISVTFRLLDGANAVIETKTVLQVQGVNTNSFAWYAGYKLVIEAPTAKGTIYVEFSADNDIGLTPSAVMSVPIKTQSNLDYIVL